MKFGGDFQSNLASAKLSKSKDYVQDVVLDEIARLIYLEPKAVAKALNSTGVKTSENPQKKELVDKVSFNLYQNPEFRREISKVIAQYNAQFKSADGGKGAEILDMLAPFGSAIGSTIEGVFGLVQAKQDRKMEEERTKQLLYMKLFGQERKNYMPVLVIGGVLLIGGIVLFLALRDKK